MAENEALQKAIQEYEENLEQEKLRLARQNYSVPLQNTIRENIRDIEFEIKWLKEIQQYRAIGTIEEFKALKDKKPKKKKSNKVIFSHDSHPHCPHCGRSITGAFMNPRLCPKCHGELDRH